MPVYKITIEFISLETIILMFLSCLLYTNNVSAAYPECEDPARPSGTAPLVVHLFVRSL